MRRDRIANERIIAFKQPGQEATVTSATYDLRQGPAGAFWAGREIPTNVLLVFNFSATVTVGATLINTVFTGDTAATCTLYATLGVMTHAATAAGMLWLAEIRDLQRYIYITQTVAVQVLDWSLTGNFNRSRREPIYQTGTEVAVTYEKNPATG